MTWHIDTSLIDKANSAKFAPPKGPSLLHFIKRSKSLADPHSILDEFAHISDEWGPICSTRTGLFERSYFVSDHKAIDTIFRDHDAFKKYPNHTPDLGKLQALIGKGMLATHTDKEWSNHRQSVARPFAHAAVMKNFNPIVLQHCEHLLDRAYDGDTKNFNISELAMLFSGRVMNDILAPNSGIQDDAILGIKHILDESILDFHKWDYKRRAKPYKAKLSAQIDHLIRAASKDTAPPGLVRTMMKSEPNWHDDQSARERLVNRALNLLVAGFETTATSLNWVVYLLAANPEIQKQLKKEVNEGIYGDGTSKEAFDEQSLLHRVLLEAMRMYTVLWFNIRYAIKDTEINGSFFKKGSRVMLLPFIANQSSKIYTKPDSFNPDRYSRGEPHPLFPFGNGQRVCIGRSLAILEMNVLVVGLLKRFNLEPLQKTAAIGGVLLQPEQDICVGLVDRKSQLST